MCAWFYEWPHFLPNLNLCLLSMVIKAVGSRTGVSQLHLQLCLLLQGWLGLVSAPSLFPFPHLENGADNNNNNTYLKAPLWVCVTSLVPDTGKRSVNESPRQFSGTVSDHFPRSLFTPKESIVFLFIHWANIHSKSNRQLQQGIHCWYREARHSTHKSDTANICLALHSLHTCSA